MAARDAREAWRTFAHVAVAAASPRRHPVRTGVFLLAVVAVVASAVVWLR